MEYMWSAVLVVSPQIAASTPKNKQMTKKQLSKEWNSVLSQMFWPEKWQKCHCLRTKSLNLDSVILGLGQRDGRGLNTFCSGILSQTSLPVFLPLNSASLRWSMFRHLRKSGIQVSVSSPSSPIFISQLFSSSCLPHTPLYSSVSTVFPNNKMKVTHLHRREPSHPKRFVVPRHTFSNQCS